MISAVGSVVSLWRYPFKSMLGEELNAIDITPKGLLGDRAYALKDSATGNIASAKHPRKWPNFFEYRASFVRPPVVGDALPAVRITLPDGRDLQSDRANVDETLSQIVGRPVEVIASPPEKPNQEEYWPDLGELLAYRNTTTDEPMVERTFFDLGNVHILTTATMARLRELYPEGQFEARRFRPNIVVETDSDEAGFVENDWVGHTLCIGDDVRLEIERACPRCLMLSLPQGDLPRDMGVLRTVAQHNDAKAGVYARVVRGGRIHRTDPVSLARAQTP